MAEWRIYASVNYALIGADDGLSPNRARAIIWHNADILNPLMNKRQWNFNRNTTIFTH